MTEELVYYDDSLLMTQEGWNRWGKEIIGTIRKDLLNYLLIEVENGQDLEKEQARKEIPG